MYTLVFELTLGSILLAAIRFILLLFYFIILNFALIIFFILRPMHRNNVYVAGQLYPSMGKLLGIKVELKISDKLLEDESYLFIANHQNTYDLVTVAKSARPGVVTVGKKSLKWIPIFGLIYWLSGNIMIDRKNSNRAQDTLKQTAEKVRKRNLSIYMFPEGTRSRGRGILPFKTGAFRLAKVTGQKIVPICCSDLSGISMNKWDNGTVIVEIMKPHIVDENENPKNTAKYFEEMLKMKYKELNEQADKLSGRA